jgi:V-ATPase subunit C
MATIDATEKELWVLALQSCGRHDTEWPFFQTELLRLSRTNFSESFQILVHLKVVRLFVESVLRYGLPANYVGLAIKVFYWCFVCCRHIQIAAHIYSPNRSWQRRSSGSCRVTLHTFHHDPTVSPSNKAALMTLLGSISHSWIRNSSILSCSRSLGSLIKQTFSRYCTEIRS